MVEKDYLNQTSSQQPINYAINAQDLNKEIIYESILANSSNSSNSNDKKTLKIIHFNDVYNVDPSHIEPKAGAARFLTAVNLIKKEHPCLVLFSGDCFSPSSCNFNF
jgi:hypothetical protein